MKRNASKYYKAFTSRNKLFVSFYKGISYSGIIILLSYRCNNSIKYDVACCQNQIKGLWVFVILDLTQKDTHSRPLRWCSRLERWPRKLKVGCSTPWCDVPKTLKQEVTAPLLDDWQKVWVSRVFGDYHYKWNPLHIRCGRLMNPQSSMAMLAEHKSKFVSIWLKNSRVRQKSINKQQYLSTLYDRNIADTA